MSDQRVREIQLGSKQLVFVFMASVVLAVAIFLLGISVGRGVGPPAGETSRETTDAAADGSTVSAVPPPATVTTPADLAYHDQLQGQTTPPALPQPKLVEAPVQAPAASAPPPSVPAPAAAEVSSKAEARGTPAPAPARGNGRAAVPAPARAAAPPAASTARGATRGWVVQVNAFRSRANADREAAQLKAKGYKAFVAPTAPGALFPVQVGPFPQRADADRTAQRLQREEGLKPSVTR